MGFTVPNFNLTCNIFRQANPPPGTPDVVSECNLAWGRRVSSLHGVEGGQLNNIMTLLLPPATDIRSAVCSSGTDVVEVPAGTGRFYRVDSVDDIGKGFPNEHRAATILAVNDFGAWPSPIP